MNLVFFDTETTGNTVEDSLCQLAYKTEGKEFCGLYNPGTKIPPEASAVHHITNKMVADKPLFKESDDYKKIKKLFEDEHTVIVAHNAVFDLAIIKKEDIQPKKFICTLRVARFLDKNEKISQYKLQYLRYFLELEVDGQAHDALGDVKVCEKLFERLKNKIISEENCTEDEAIEKMIEISSTPTLIRTLGFGKYKGKKVTEVLAIDRGWLEWLYGEKMKSNEIDEDWIYTLKHYLDR